MRRPDASALSCRRGIQFFSRGQAAVASSNPGRRSLTAQSQTAPSCRAGELRNVVKSSADDYCLRHRTICSHPLAAASLGRIPRIALLHYSLFSRFNLIPFPL
jgi:hypothetical protein